MYRYFSLNAALRQRFGERVQKIPLDAGFDCPNRDGTLSREGCIFCNPSGSGSGMLRQGSDLRAQWAHWAGQQAKRYKAHLFIGYLQSYTNTYGPLERIADTLSQLENLPGLAALSIGTRPDCLDSAKLELIASQKEKLDLDEIFLELGLQTAHDDTLRHINRGHGVADFERAARQASDLGLNVVAHVIAGLPSPAGREGQKELLETVEFVNALPVRGIKFHNLYVCKGTRLAKLWKDGGYAPLTRDEYCQWLGEALMLLSPATVVHRLNGDPAQGELLTPDWAGEKREVHNALRSHLEQHDIWQGKRNGAPDGPPPHFSPDFRE
ncbi:TIGR01212 family radical SAM protein [Salidesulfovibrio onnuriiensis]|uniref:TIGR01212 family radical SAM protein n=1 Tax=Salidesulfovibrio onnuriiensis TaxID=2583823 RepID=UPI0011CA2C4A|nr:TIGR01212 family radical SAM protein [Salidesulfovibrio onnuriiensis]